MMNRKQLLCALTSPLRHLRTGLSHCLTVLLIASFLVTPFTARAAPAADPAFTGGGLVIAEAETFASGLGATVTGSGFDLASSLPASSRLTPQDYQTAYQEARRLFEIGSNFRMSDLQRQDPANCTEPDNPDACRFSTTRILNNYLDITTSQKYWRFCADYDEPYVGASLTEQQTDDPGNVLQFNAYGYCPLWANLNARQKELRVTDGDTVLGTGPKDIRNSLIDAMRLFAFLAIAEPASLKFDGLKFLADNKTLVLGVDGVPDRVREIGIVGLLQTMREVANVHLIFGNEFMVSALRFPFSAGPDASTVVANEQKMLLAAVHQYSLAVNAFLYGQNFRLDESSGDLIAKHFGPREFQTFAAASESMALALGEVAKRDRLLGTDGAALNRLNQAYLDQYLQGLAITANLGVDRQHFLNNGGRQILDTLRRLEVESNNIRRGLNPLGYDDKYVPIVPFFDLYNLACCETNTLHGAAILSFARLRDDQNAYIESYETLRGELTTLKNDFNTQLTELCGVTQDDAPEDGVQDDIDGDGLPDWKFCGPHDATGDGKFDREANSGLMGQNYWSFVAANKDIALAQQQAINITKLISAEVAATGQVISITLAGGETLGGYELAIGALNANRTISTTADSTSKTDYADVSGSVEIGGRVYAKYGTAEGDTGVGVEGWAQVTFNTTGGARWEWQHLDTTETIYDPNAAGIGNYENLKQLKEAAIQADVEQVRSAQRVKELLIQETEQLIQVENAQIELKRVVAEHNMLRDRYMLLLSQRAAAKEQLAASNLAKPYYRLARDSAALATARTLDAAVQVLYLAAKAYEYDTLTPYSGMNRLYLVRNENDVYEAANKLRTEYTLALDPNRNFSIGKHNLSLAQDVLGLRDAILNPDGTLSPAEVEQLRRVQFQTLLSQARRGDKLTFTFATTVDNPEFLRSVWNERITDAASTMPGCATGCRGLWVNLVTDQPATDFAGGLPVVRLTQGGVATYRNSAGQTVSYRPGPAAIVGFRAPAGLDKNDAVDVLSANVNAASNSEPSGGSFSNKFRMRSVAAGKWMLELDLTETVNHPLQLDKIYDIEIGFDTTYLTLTDANALSAANAGVESVQINTQQTVDLNCTPDTNNAFLGVADVTAPVSLGTVSLGFDLYIAPDGRVSGKLRNDCSPLYDRSAALTGSYDATTRRIAFASEPLTRTVAGRLAMRSLSFTGIVTDSILIDGVYTETIQGYTAEPVVAGGIFLVSRPSSNVTSPGNNDNQAPLAINDNFSVAANSANNVFDVLTNDRVANGAAKLLVAVGTPTNGVATSNGATILYTPNPGFEGNDSFTYTVGDSKLTSVGTVTVKVGSGSRRKFIYLPLVSR